MSEENKAMVRRVLERMDQGDIGAFAEAMTPDYVAHFPGAPGPLDGQGHEQMARMFYQAFPDLKHTIEDQIAEGDKVVSRITISGTHEGDFQGMAPTGKQVSFSAIMVTRLAGGKAAEQWVELDGMGMIQQLGAIPAVAPA